MTLHPCPSRSSSLAILIPAVYYAYCLRPIDTTLAYSNHSIMHDIPEPTFDVLRFFQNIFFILVLFLFYNYYDYKNTNITKEILQTVS